MKKFLWVVALISLVSVPIFAHPGGHNVDCKSIPAKGSKSIEFHLGRANGLGWTPPSWTLVIDKKKYEFKPEDEMKGYGETVRDVALGLIYITADNIEDGEANQGSFSLMAIPNSVKIKGLPPKWSLKNEKDDCHNLDSEATFNGIFRGLLKKGEKDLNLDPVMMSCKWVSDAGMAC